MKNLWLSACFLFFCFEPSFGTLNLLQASQAPSIAAVIGSQPSQVCGRGTYALSGSSYTCQCDKGYYGTTECVACNTGYTTPGNGSTAATNCNVCKIGYEPGASGACTACPTGKTSAAVNSPCSNCAGGFTRTGTDCRACGAGTYSNGTSTCLNCVAGKFSVGSAAVCTGCPAGKFSDGPGLSECSDCPNGTYTSDIGRSECLVSYNIPPWTFRVFNGIMLFLAAASLFGDLSLGAPLTNKSVDHHKYIGFLLFFLYSATIFVFAAMRFPSMAPFRDYVLLGMGGTALLAFIALVATPSTRPRMIKGAFGLPFVFSILLYSIVQIRLIFPTILHQADLTLLLCIYIMIQVLVTHIFINLSRIGLYVHGSTLLFLMMIMIIMLLLPIVIIKFAFDTPESEWMAHDLGNVNVVNGVFGLGVAGFTLALKGLTTVKKSLEDSTKAVKLNNGYITKATRYLLGLQTKAITERYSGEIKEFVSDTYKAANAQRAAKSSALYSCLFFSPEDAPKPASAKPVIPTYPVVSGSVMCKDASGKKFERACKFTLQCDVEPKTDEELRDHLKDDLNRIIKASQVMIDASKELSVDYRFPSRIIEKVVTDSVVSQLLIAAGFYPAIYGLAVFSRNNRTQLDPVLLYHASSVITLICFATMAWGAFSAFNAGGEFSEDLKILVGLARKAQSSVSLQTSERQPTGHPHKEKKANIDDGLDLMAESPLDDQLTHEDKHSRAGKANPNAKKASMVAKARAMDD